MRSIPPPPLDLLHSPVPLSYLILTRLSDGRQITSDGNLNSVDDYGTRRFFSAPVIANETYIVTIVPPTNNPDFFPANISMGYRDGGGCAGPVTFLVPSSPTAQWIVRDNRPNVVNWR